MIMERIMLVQNYKFKQKAENLYLDFWNVPSDDERRSDQAYTMPLLNRLTNNKVLIVGLDTRYFRSNIQELKECIYLILNHQLLY